MVMTNRRLPVWKNKENTMLLGVIKKKLMVNPKVPQRTLRRVNIKMQPHRGAINKKHMVKKHGSDNLKKGHCLWSAAPTGETECRLL